MGVPWFPLRHVERIGDVPNVGSAADTAPEIGAEAAEPRNYIRYGIKNKPDAAAQRGLLRTALTTILTVSVLASVIVVAGTGLPVLFGFKIMAVTSGSMEPVIHVGDAVVLEKSSAASIEEGDLITFAACGNDSLVTHRVIGIRNIDGKTYYQTKGDANNSPDVDLAPDSAVVGKVVLTEAKMGYIAVLASSMNGKIAFMGFPLILTLALELQEIIASARRRRVRESMAGRGSRRGAAISS